MMTHKIITIGRQFGSGGHEIGNLLATRLDIPLYDNNLVRMAAEEMDIRVCDFVRRIAGKDTVTLLYASKNAAGNHALILQEYLARATAAAGVTNVRYS